MTKRKIDWDSNPELLALWEAYKDAMTMDEFARATGLSYGSLKNRLYRAGKLPQVSPRMEQDTVSVTEDGPNVREVSASGRRVRNLDDLREVTGFGTEEWEAFDVEIKTWEGYRKALDKDLSFEEGKITGYVTDQGKLTIETLYSVKAKFVRTQLEQMFPHIQPVELCFVAGATQHKEYLSSDLRHALIIPDTQIGLLRELRTGGYEPIHDRNAMGVVWSLAEMYHWDDIVILGDWLDMSDFTTHFSREPKFYFTTQPALIESAWWLGKLRSWNPDANILMLEGNHEERMKRSVLDSLNASYHLRSPFELELPPALSVENLLGLHQLNIKYFDGYPNNEAWLSPRLRVIHGNISRSGYGSTAKAYLDKATATTIFGHIHKIEHLCKRVREYDDERPISAACPGFLGRLDYIVPGHSVGTEWQQGFAIVDYDDDRTFVQIHEIYQDKHYKAHSVVEGQEVFSFFDIDALRWETADSGWKL